MNLPNIKDIFQKLSVLKNNPALLISIIISLVGILLFLPTQLMSNKLKKQIDEQSISKVKELEGYKENPISNEQLEIEQQKLDAQILDVNEISQIALQTSKRQLLHNDIFTLDPNDPNSIFSRLTFQQFGQKYREGIDEMIAKANAHDCPTEVELERALEKSGAGSRLRTSSVATTYSVNTSRQQTDNLANMIYDQICLQRARSITVYATPVNLSNYEFWADFQYNQAEEAIETCWYSQLAYWVIEDIFDTVITMNSEHENVLGAPIKRLMYLTFKSTTGRTSSSDSATSGSLDIPKYVISAEEELTTPYTGRYSKEDIDVIHFKVKFVIDFNALLPFINELYKVKEHTYIDDNGIKQTFLHNQITILNSQIEHVNPYNSDHLYYRYGDGSIIELDLTCEYIFNRKGYEDIMPKSVKTMFQEVDEQI